MLRVCVPMATRNLTKQFVGIRNANKANKNLRVRMDIRPSMSSDDGSSDSGLLNANETPYKSVKDSLPPVWVDKLEKAEEDLTKIQIKSALLLFYYFHFFFSFAVGGVYLPPVQY